jgi:SAM-dependent methyltransferase
MDYEQVIASLRLAYNEEKARWRDQRVKEDWKIAERQHFLTLLKQEHSQTLLEVGAGTGVDSLFFQSSGLRVICTDLAPAMVRCCREKGLEAYTMDFLHLDFPPASFDALYALNCLLHVPTGDLPAVLHRLRDLLRPGGLFFLGVYGGSEEEGVDATDQHIPPRFFARHTDDALREVTGRFFEVVSFKTIPLAKQHWHFQSLILRREKEAGQKPDLACPLPRGV